MYKQASSYISFFLVQFYSQGAQCYVEYPLLLSLSPSPLPPYLLSLPPYLLFSLINVQLQWFVQEQWSELPRLPPHFRERDCCRRCPPLKDCGRKVSYFRSLSLFFFFFSFLLLSSFPPLFDCLKGCYNC